MPQSACPRAPQENTLCAVGSVTGSEPRAQGTQVYHNIWAGKKTRPFSGGDNSKLFIQQTSLKTWSRARGSWHLASFRKWTCDTHIPGMCRNRDRKLSPSRNLGCCFWTQQIPATPQEGRPLYGPCWLFQASAFSGGAPASVDPEQAPQRFRRAGHHNLPVLSLSVHSTLPPELSQEWEQVFPDACLSSMHSTHHMPSWETSCLKSQSPSYSVSQIPWCQVTGPGVGQAVSSREPVALPCLLHTLNAFSLQPPGLPHSSGSLLLPWDSRPEACALPP